MGVLKTYQIVLYGLLDEFSKCVPYMTSSNTLDSTHNLLCGDTSCFHGLTMASPCGKEAPLVCRIF